MHANESIWTFNNDAMEVKLRLEYLVLAFLAIL